MPSGLPAVRPFTLLSLPKALLLIGLIALVEVLSQLVRLVSLSFRLFFNMLAGHLVIAVFLGLASLLGTLLPRPPIGLPMGVALYTLECTLIAGLQAFIFATLSASTSVERSTLTTRRTCMALETPPGAAKAIELGIGDRDSAPSARASASVHLRQDHRGRRPPARAAGPAVGIMWLGFALTEAIVFYALGMAFVAYAILVADAMLVYDPPP